MSVAAGSIQKVTADRDRSETRTPAGVAMPLLGTALVLLARQQLSGTEPTTWLPSSGHSRKRDDVSAV
jgi:hypothetical protein